MSEERDEKPARQAKRPIQQRVVMGPPSYGPTVQVNAPGLFLAIQVNDWLDAEILQMVLARAEQRRYGKAI